MKLKLAFVLATTADDCQVKRVDDQQNITVVYAQPIRDYHITIQIDDLVVIDTNTTPPRLVYRSRPARVEQIVGNQVRTAHGTFNLPPELQAVVGDRVCPDNETIVAVLRADQRHDFTYFEQTCFPRIRRMYQRLDLGTRALVEQGYDQIADTYLEWAQHVRVAERQKYTDLFLENVSAGATVLELGCGPGVPTTQILAQHYAVTGVDFSAEQTRRARQHVPDSTFIQADMTTVEFESASFDAVIAIASIIHVPRSEQPALFQNIAHWLRPDGLLIVSLGASDSEHGYEDDWLGAPMYWSSYDTATNRQMIVDAGFEIISATEETATEFDEPVTFLWVVARNRG